MRPIGCLPFFIRIIIHDVPQMDHELDVVEVTCSRGRSDAKVYIDPQSFTYLKGTKVDFVSEGVNEEVKFLNPNVKAVCGCGETFEID